MRSCPDRIEALLAASPDFARLLLHFNYCPAEYLHVSHRNQLNLGQLADCVWQTRRSLPPISAYILDQLCLQEKICLDPSYSEWPLVLLSPARLKRLQQYVAAVLYAETIRLCLLPEDIIRWRTILGYDAYKFALTGTKLLPQLRLRSYTDIDDVETVSNSWISAAMSTAPEAISIRAKLKIPVLTNIKGIELQKAHRLMFSLLSILEPKWCSFFLTTLTR